MPINVKPQKAEHEHEFVARAHKELFADVPDSDKRNAIIFGIWRDSHGESEEEKRAQVDNVRAFQARHAERSGEALQALAASAQAGENTFGKLMEAVKSCSLGTITHSLYLVGGQYRRNM